MLNGDRHKCAAWGAEMSSEGWWAAGVDNNQVNSVPLRERRWRADVTERLYDEKRLLMGGR